MAEPCGRCGGPVEQSGVGRPRVYCSTVCRRGAQRQRRLEREIERQILAEIDGWARGMAVGFFR